MFSLHKNTTATPAIRAKIAGSAEPAAVLARPYGVTLETIENGSAKVCHGSGGIVLLQAE